MIKAVFFRFNILLLIMVMVVSCATDNKEVVNQVSLSQDWQLFSSETVSEDGSKISNSSFTINKVYKANVPTTVLHALVQNGVYDSVYVGLNLDKIDTAQFQKPWWYRNVFNVTEIGNNYELKFEGINYKANIWLNGKLIADTSVVNNAFKMFSFNVSEIIKLGDNVLAVEVFAPVAGDFSIGFVDWNPSPADQNMGIFRNVSISTINKVQIFNPFVESHFKNDDYSTAYQNVSLSLKNYSDNDVSGKVLVQINGKNISKDVRIASKSVATVSFSTNEYKELIVKDAKLWWPYTIGKPIMHNAKFSFIESDNTLDSKEIAFGIREIKDFYNKDGHRGLMVNGEKISIRGGGWVDNMMLDNTHSYDQAQLDYVKNMNLNTIRLEGFWGKDDHIYSTCDSMGILVLVGWSCHWEWENYLGTYCDEKYGGILNDNDIEMMSIAWQDQIIWLRNHPAIIGWFGGSDCIPAEKLQDNYFEIFKKYDSTRIYFSSAKEWESEEIVSGVKMRGPYAYEPPVYWFADTLYGGAFGFNTETGPGAQVPPIESIRKMIPNNDLWPINKVWDFHCGRNEFNTLERYTLALNNRYGAAKSVEEYAIKAQLLNYELMRPMFEAFSVNRYDATGVVQWMLNSAWPEMYWQLYDSYLMPNGAFYATKKAGEPLHALYNYNDKCIYLVNDRLQNEENITITVSVYDINSKKLFSKEVLKDIAANSSMNILQIPEIKNLSKTYFLDIRITKAKKEVANNFYWLSTKADVLDYEFEFESWYYHTPSKQFADFTLLNTMPKAELKSSLAENKLSNYTEYTISLENTTNNIAFFIELQLIDKENGELILPTIMSDNYVSLIANEKRDITVRVDNKYIGTKQVDLRVKGYNL